jgi:hypothetical protein
MLVKRGARRRHRLVRAFAVEYAYGNQGACGQRSKTAAYLFNFLLVQITSTLANQYSVLVIHVFSPFIILGPFKRAQTRQKGFGSATPARDAA